MIRFLRLVVASSLILMMPAIAEAGKLRKAVAAVAATKIVVKALSKKAVIKKAGLPTQGRIRYVPQEGLPTGASLPRGPNGGYMDKFGNEWVKGPSRTAGQPYEWDVQLSRTGRQQLGDFTRDGSHLNVSMDGRITHK